MKEIFERIASCYQSYCGTGTQFLLFLVTLLFLMTVKHKKKLYTAMIQYSYFILLIMVCPVTAVIIMDYLIGEEVYWRMFWLLPIPIIIAAAGVEMIAYTKKKSRKMWAFFMATVIIMLTGGLVYDTDTVTLAQNMEKIPQQVEEVCNVISADALQNEIQVKKVVVPKELLSYIRQYDATIEMPYGRNGIKDKQYLSEDLKQIVDLMEEDEVDYFLLSGYLKQEACNYLVLDKERASTELETYGYMQVAQTGEYMVYRCDDFEKHEWKITQRASEQMNSMFYTIQSDLGNLIVVDGGWKDDADDVRQVIKELGNKVDAWIITHPHKDHAGAFCAIYPDLQGMQIEQVYAVDMAPEDLCEENAPWDTFETLEAFNSLEIPQLQYVYKGDHLSVAGLEIDILSAYDEYVDENSNDLLNDGSMMFKVNGQKQSMLFCADVGISLDDYLISAYGSSLKADYIQMGHHGNGGLSKEFYKIVNPKAAFFDAGKDLMDPPKGSTWTTPENREWMENLGAEIYCFEMGDNSVILE